jgi:hypothetical protein
MSGGLIVGLDWRGVAAAGHVVVAVTALGGAAVLGLRKGVGSHRLAGSAYVVCLVTVDLASLSVAAGCGQLAVTLTSRFDAWTVPTVIGTVLAVSG